MNDLLTFRDKFNREINFYLDGKVKEFGQLDKEGVGLVKAIKELINYGGKKFRPALFYFAFRSYSSERLNDVFKMSFVFELFHTFALLHDDIIDKSDKRRGQPTIHKKYGQETAILAGDLALMFCDELFTIRKENQKLVNLYNQFKQETLLGEYLDTIKSGSTEKIMELKTTRYSFSKPIIIGLTLAEVANETVLKWEKLANDVGILFQIKDDYIGTFGDEKITGKPTSDFFEGKKSVLVDYFLERAGESEKNKFKNIFGKQSGENNFQWYRNKLIEKNVEKDVKELIQTEVEKQINLLMQNEVFANKSLTNLLIEILNVIKKF
jgi:geranylgeranyl diphosphate synthase, type I